MRLAMSSKISSKRAPGPDRRWRMKITGSRPVVGPATFGWVAWIPSLAFSCRSRKASQMLLCQPSEFVQLGALFAKCPDIAPAPSEFSLVFLFQGSSGYIRRVAAVLSSCAGGGGAAEAGGCGLEGAALARFLVSDSS